MISIGLTTSRFRPSARHEQEREMGRDLEIPRKVTVPDKAQEGMYEALVRLAPECGIT